MSSTILDSGIIKDIEEGNINLPTPYKGTEESSPIKQEIMVATNDEPLKHYPNKSFN